MKKNNLEGKIITIIILVVIAIVSIIGYMFFKRYQALDHNKNKIMNNSFFESHNREITGAELINLINKAYSKNSLENEKEETVAKEMKPFYPNDKTSVIIDVQIDGRIISMKSIIESGPENFFKNLNEDKFDAMMTQYHDNGNISYMVFELKV